MNDKTILKIDFIRAEIRYTALVIDFHLLHCTLHLIPGSKPWAVDSHQLRGIAAGFRVNDRTPRYFTKGIDDIPIRFAKLEGDKPPRANDWSIGVLQIALFRRSVNDLASLELDNIAWRVVPT